MIGLILAVSLSIHHLKHNDDNQDDGHDDDDAYDYDDDDDAHDAYDDPYDDADISRFSIKPLPTA